MVVVAAPSTGPSPLFHAGVPSGIRTGGMELMSIVPSGFVMILGSSGTSRPGVNPGSRSDGSSPPFPPGVNPGSRSSGPPPPGNSPPGNGGSSSPGNPGSSPPGGGTSPGLSPPGNPGN